VPNGKQSHYLNIGGLWQGVRLLAREKVFVHSAFLLPEVEESKVLVRLVLFGAEEIPNDGLYLSLRVVPGGGEARVKAIKGRAVYDVEVPVRKLRLWSPGSPFLYRLEIRLQGEGVDDLCFVDFGMRKVEAKENKILLNGEPIYLIGALDQAFYPDVIYGTPSDELLRDQFLKAKELGLNFLRTHIKIPCPNYLDWADRLGLMLWVDFPSFYKFTEKARERMRRELIEWIWRDFNHPSIFCWCLVNEEWGVPLLESEEARRWLKEMWQFTKSLDPTRLVVDNSPVGAGHIISDIEDYHVYRAIPEHAREFEAWVEKFSTHPSWTFRFPESERRGFEPLVVSEFGNWGLPDVEEILRHYGGKDPYWFNQRSYGGPIRGGIEAFFNWGLSEVYGSLKGLAEATQRHQLSSLKFEIETMRLHPEICGYVITQFTDLNSESNGLLDMCRNAKLLHRFMRYFQGQDVVLIRPERWAYVEGEEVRAEVFLSRFSRSSPEVVEWWAEGAPAWGRIEGISVKRADCKKVGEIRFTAPEALAPTKLTIWARALDGEGREVCRNYQELWLLPKGSVEGDGRLWVIGGSDNLARRLKGMGFEIVPQSEAELALSIGVDKRAVEFVREGGRALFLLDEVRALQLVHLLPLRIAERGEKGWWGDWCTAFLWLKGEVVEGLPYEGHLGMPFLECVPHKVIDGLNPEAMRDALGGIFVGWMHNQAATILPVRVGRGVALLCTFRLTETVGKDPVATALLCSLIRLLRKINPSSLRTEIRPPSLDKILAKPAPMGGEVWRYTTSRPPQGWEQPDFDDSTWREGRSGFGRPGTPGAVVGTKWLSSEIWLRFKGIVKGKVKSAAMVIHHDEDVEVYLNGKLIFSERGFLTDYKVVLLGPEALKAFREGENTLAVHCRQTGGGQFVDVGILYAVEE
ncbi:MAG TPA: hypothetical protein EYP65_06350, partial [Armatimonadetes bacterium]|nr:hypothetical protein [Armatimonadota bacterium]